MNKREYSTVELMGDIFGGAFLGSIVYNIIGAIVGAVLGLGFYLYSNHVRNKNNNE